MDVIKEYWAIILSLLGGYAWLLRSEGRITAAEVELRRQAEHRRDMETRIEKSLNTIEADIKKILTRGIE